MRKDWYTVRISWTVDKTDKSVTTQVYAKEADVVGKAFAQFPSETGLPCNVAYWKM